ncbi:MAG: flagellar hook capping protein [Lachnospiraceae bacterium]|nr:flagellar hook capping protein [Lachnospiraceae bacterium]
MGVVQEVKDGKFVDNTSATSMANEKAKKTGNSSLDKDAFLQLLVAQMKYQDPLEPTSNTEYISQFATFSELEQMQNMSATLELSRASSLVGQTVLMSVTDSSGRTTTVQGNVDFVSYEGGKAYLSIGGELYSLDDLDKVADKKYLDAYALAAEFLSIINKLPDVSLLTIDNKEKVDRLEEIYNGMDDYQKGFLTDDYFEKAEAYIKRMKDITPNPDGDGAPNADGDDKSKTDGSGES